MMQIVTKTKIEIDPSGVIFQEDQTWVMQDDGVTAVGLASTHRTPFGPSSMAPDGKTATATDPATIQNEQVQAVARATWTPAVVQAAIAAREAGIAAQA